MRKILILSLLIISLFVVFVIPASAAVLQPFDYVTNLVGTEDGYLVTIDFPDNFQYWEYYSSDSYIGSNFGPSVTVDLQENEIDNAMFQVSLMGASGGYNRFETVYLTNDAQLKLDFTMSLRFSKSVSQSFDGTIGVRLAYYDANGNYIKTENVADIPFSCSNVVANRDVTIFNGSKLFPVDRSVGAYFRYYLTLDFTNIQNENVITQMTMTVTDNSVIQMPLSSLYVQQQQTGESNKILSQVEQQLQANGEKLDDVLKEQQSSNDKLDDIINGTVPPYRPDREDKIDDLDNQEGQLRDDASDGLQQGLDMMDDTLDALFTYSFGFFALGMVFELFFQLPFFNVLVSLSLVLGILASFLGIIVSISSVGGGRYSKAKSHHQRSPKSNHPKQGGKA